MSVSLRYANGYHKFTPCVQIP